MSDVLGYFNAFTFFLAVILFLFLDYIGVIDKIEAKVYSLIHKGDKHD